MTYADTTTSETRAITAFYDTRAAAEDARAKLIAIGVAPGDVSLVEGGATATTATATTTTPSKSMWDELKDFFLPDEDRYAYAEGLKRGGFLLSARTDHVHYDRALEILDAEGSVNIEEREQTWRAEGWKGYEASAPASLAAPVATASTPAVAAMAAPAASSLRTSGADQAIQLVEEQLRVGKRDTSHGRVRLRSYVVETPVQEQVNLRTESVAVQRRSVDRPITATDDLFRERVIEAEEHAEEAVVSKEARVTGEVSLEKTVQDRAQTVSDTVRRTDVKVEDDRLTGGARRFAFATDSASIQPHMNVVGSDGQVVGTVDHLEGVDRLKLTKMSSPDGMHHFIPVAWIESVDQQVHLAKTAVEAKAGWTS